MLERVISKKSGWARVAFGDVVQLSKVRSKDPEAEGYKRVVGLEHIDPGDLRIRRWADISDGTTFTSAFEPGQVLFGKRRAYQRKVAVANFSGVCSGDIYVLESSSDALMPELLPFICQTDNFFDHAVGTSAGSLSPRTNWKSLATFEFMLPPIQEQSRLVGALSARQQLLDKLEDTLAALLSLEGSFLKEHFGENYKANRHGFERSKLSDLAVVHTGLAKGKKPSASSVEMPYLRVANVKDGELDLNEIKEIVVERAQVGRYTLRAGDVLMTEGGDLDKLGRGTVWQEEIENCLHQNHVFAVRVDSKKLDPWYLAALARSTYGKSYFLQCAKRTSNLASINKRQVLEMIIPHPPISTQRKWLEFYSNIRNQQDEIKRRIASCKALGALIFRQGLNRDL